MAASTTAAAAGSDARRIVLWANPIPLECGIISSADRSSTKLTLHMLRKLLNYAKNKGKHAFPWLSYSVWQHIACSKLHMSEDLSWLYFETFDSISDVDSSDRLKLLGLVNKCSNKEELDRLHKQVHVDTARFMLLLFIQNATRLSLKTPMLTGEEWPSPEAEHRHTTRNSVEHSHLSFIKSHLHEMLQLVAEPAGGEVSLEGLQALEFLIIGTADKKTLSPLTTLAAEHTHSSFSQTSETFSLPVLEQWIKTRLVMWPFGPQAMKGGARDRRCGCYRSESIGRIVTNSLLAPQGTQSALLYRINKQTLAKGEEGLVGSSVHIQNCRGSFIYLLAPVKCVMVEKCARCVIVLGAVERVVTVTSCSSIKLVATCRRLHVSSSAYCTFHLLCMTRPVLSSNCHALSFAPYNTYYPQLRKHLEQCGLVNTINYWDHPLNVGGGGLEGGAWSLMEPEEFASMEIPFKMEGDTRENPCVLPQLYQDTLTARQRRIQEWYTAVQEASLTTAQQQQLQDIVQVKFQEWLKDSGRKKEIYDLQRAKSRRQAAPS